jgi:hypothetical protein
MSNNNGFKAFLVIIGSLVFIGIFIGLAIDEMFHSDITVGQEVGMCQPGGWNLDRDYRCAEVNVLNSSANVNNGEAHLYNAKATAVIQEARIRSEEQYYEGIVSGALQGFCLSAACLLFLLFVGYAFYRSQQYGTTA